MTRSWQQLVIQQLIDTCWDITRKGLAEQLWESEILLRNIYNGTNMKSLSIAKEKKLREIIDKKIRNLIKIIQFIDKH